VPSVDDQAVMNARNKKAAYFFFHCPILYQAGGAKGLRSVIFFLCCTLQ
jgi:hypothetical protein